MSDSSDTPQSEGAYPLLERVRFAQWFPMLLERDRSGDYREVFWDLLRALLTQYQGDGKDGIEPRSVSTQELWRWTLAQEPNRRRSITAAPPLSRRSPTTPRSMS